jgi:hypothetical protein
MTVTPTFNAMTSALAPTEENALKYMTAVNKGRKLLMLMRSPTPAPGSGQFTSVSDLDKHGYSLRQYGCDDAIQNYAEMLEDLGTDDAVRSFPDDDGLGGDNIDIMHVHAHDVTIDGVLIPRAEAYFCSVLIVRAGILVATNNHVPQASHRVPLPALRHWSDVAFLQWSLLPSLGVSTPPLNYILRAGIENKATIAIISHVLGYSASIKTYYDDAEVRRPAWPGTTFAIDKSDALALLGTPNGSGVGWLLAQHKAELGHRVVTQVTVFFDTDESGVEAPNLLFGIAEAPESGSLVSKI